jgi:hypothetical protein
MATCDTCKHLAVPKNEDHAKHYYVCKVVTPFPANMHIWDRNCVEGREEGSARFITRKIVHDLKHMLVDCSLWEHRP